MSGIPEALHHGVHALLTPPGDDAAIATALGSLLGDPSLRSTLGNAARARAIQGYSVEVMTDAYEVEYGLRTL